MFHYVKLEVGEHEKNNTHVQYYFMGYLTTHAN